MVALLSSVWGLLECFVLCSVSMPSFLWNGNGRPVSCGNKKLAPETNRVSERSRPPKSWQPSQHSVWIMGDTRGLLLLCSFVLIHMPQAHLVHPTHSPIAIYSPIMHPTYSPTVHPTHSPTVHPPLCTLNIIRVNL